MQIVIDIDENVFTRLFDNGTEDYKIVNDDLFAIAKAIRKGTPLTPYVLANMLMEERITGSLEQNMSCSRDVIDNVRCKLTVEIIDRRPCYCGAELRAVWRERKESEE